jgi:hypothetical protein
MVSRLQCGRLIYRSSIPGRGKRFFFFHSVLADSGTAMLFVRQELGASSPKVKRPECEADHSPISSVEIKTAWSYTSTQSVNGPYLSRGTLSPFSDLFHVPLSGRLRWVGTVGWVVNNKLERMWKEAVMVWSEVLARNLSGGTEENKGNLSRYLPLGARFESGPRRHETRAVTTISRRSDL